MSNPTVPASPLPPQTVRILTPVFAFQLEGADSFTHAGTHKGADFKVELRPYTGPADIEGIINHTHVKNRDLIRQGFHPYFPITKVSHFLSLEVALVASRPDVRLDTPIPSEIQLSIVEALRLHTSAGLPNDEQFVFSDNAVLGLFRWASRQMGIFHLPTPSILRGADFAACGATGDILRSKTWGNTTFDKVDHAFLILIVAFEAMFKKKDEVNASRAAQRIGRLLGGNEG